MRLTLDIVKVTVIRRDYRMDEIYLELDEGDISEVLGSNYTPMNGDIELRAKTPWKSSEKLLKFLGVNEYELITITPDTHKNEVIKID